MLGTVYTRHGDKTRDDRAKKPQIMPVVSIRVNVQSYKFIRQTRPDVKRPGYFYKGRWPGVLARRALYV